MLNFPIESLFYGWKKLYRTGSTAPFRKVFRAFPFPASERKGCLKGQLLTLNDAFLKALNAAGGIESARLDTRNAYNRILIC